MYSFRRRVISSLLALLMLFSACGNLWMPVSAADLPANNQQQIEATGGSKTQHGVTFSKTISKTEDENYFDITLTATDTQTTDENSIDVVLVMDISNTMNTNNRLANARAAAWAFIQAFGSSQNLSYNRRVGLVTFNSDAAIRLDLQYPNQSMKGTIDAITAPYSSRRFTNIEGGLLLAQKMLKTSNTPAEHQFVILITDGFPTTYTQTQGGRTMTGYDTQAGVFTDYVKGIKCSGTDYSDKSATAAQNAAKSLKDSNVNVVSIGIDIGGQTIQGYIDKFKDNPDVSTVERAKGVHPNYVIGHASSASDYENWLKNKIGGGPALTGGLSSFYSGDDAQKLGTAFSDILATIESTTTHTMRNPVVVDPMGSGIEFLGFYDKNGKLDADHRLVGTSRVGEENTASYTSRINWDLSKSGYTVKQVSSKTTQYIYTLKYRVHLNNELSNFKENTDYVTNGATTLTFDGPDGKHTVNYPIPEVEGYLGSFHFTKTNGLTGSDRKTLSGAEFKLSHKSTCSVCRSAGHKVSIPDQTATSDGEGKVEFTRIPSGHEYTLTETRPPLGYSKNNTAYQIGVHYDTVYLAGSVLTDGDMGTVANTSLPPAEVVFEGLKQKDGKAPQESFTFQLRDRDGKLLDTASNSADGAFRFDAVSFSSVGTYIYEIAEVDPENSDIIYDRSIYHVTVDVQVDNELNPTKLVPTVTYRNHNSGETADNARFNNTTRQSAVVHLQAHKTLVGNRTLQSGEFSFELYQKQGDTKTVLQTLSNDINGDVSFEGISLHDEGTFTYYIAEKLPASPDAHIDYDETVWQVTVKVTASREEPIYVAEVTYTNLSDSKTGEKAEFTNTLKELPNENVTFSFTKTLLDETKPLADIRFRLSHNPSCCEAMSEASFQAKTADSNENGVVEFADVPSGHRYILEEVTTQVGEQYLQAADRHVAILYGKAYIDGVLAEAADSVIIKNVPTDHARVILAARKQMDGGAALKYDRKFTFDLYEKGGSTPIDTQTNLSTLEGGQLLSEVIFNPIYFEHDGIYYYQLKEQTGNDPSIVYDDTTYYITMVVQGAGSKECTCEEALCTPGHENTGCPACALGHINCTYTPTCSCELLCETAGNDQCQVCKEASDLSVCQGAKCTCTEKRCAEDDVNSACPACAKGYSNCKYTAPADDPGQNDSSDPTCSCTDKCTDTGNADCPVCKDAEDLSVCTGKAAEVQQKSIPTPTCSCTDKCTDTGNADCPVCKDAEDLSVCTGKAAEVQQNSIPTPTCSCTDKCTDTGNADCPVCKDAADLSVCTGKDASGSNDSTDPADNIRSGSGTNGSTPRVTVYVSANGYYTPATADAPVPSGVTVYQGSSSIVFDNASRGETTAQLVATKTMSGKDSLGTYSFALLDAEGHVLQTKQNDANGNVKFDEIIYKAVGEHTYFIKEIPGENTGISYDPTVYKAVVTVTAPAGSSTYRAVAQYYKDSTGVKEAVFVNRIYTMLVLKKADENNAPMAGAEFTLTHSEDCGCKEDIAPITATSRDDGEVVLSGITSGHTYMLDESKPREGYVTAPQHKVVVKDGTAVIYDVAETGGWTEITDEVHTIINYPKAKVILSGNKVMIGKTLTGNDYTFELLSSDMQVMESVKNAADGTFAFTTLEFDHTHEGNHTYYIREKLPEGISGNTKDGVTYDTSLYKVTVTVDVDKEHQVSAQTSIEKVSQDAIASQSIEGVVFTNTYSVNGDVTVKLSGTKILEGRKLNMNEFYFSIFMADENFVVTGNPIKTLSNGTRSDPNAPADASIIDFDDRTYTTQGEFHYVITEHQDDLGGVTYDTAKYHMTIKVEDNGIGGLKATVTLKNTRTNEITTFTSGNPTVDSATGKQHAVVNATVSNTTTPFQFKNTYAPSGDVKYIIEGRKLLEGDRPLRSGEFAFALYQTDASFTVADESDYVEKVTNKADSTFAFSALQFDVQDIGNKFYYAVKELQGDTLGVTYDTTVYKITLEVYDDLAGKPAVRASIDDGKPQANSTNTENDPLGDTGSVKELLFKNTFSDEGLAPMILEGTKTLKGDKTLSAGEFTFLLFKTGQDFRISSGDSPIDTQTNDARGNFRFDTLYYDENLTDNHYYVVREAKGSVLGMTYDDTIYYVTVTVSGTGEDITAVKSIRTNDGKTASSLKFVNTYVSPDIQVPINVVKTVKNVSTGTAKPDGFKFLLKDQDGKEQTATSNSSGKAAFTLTFGEADIGKTYTYTLTEVDTKLKNFTYSTESYKFEISISLNSNNKIVAAIKKDGVAVSTASGSFENIYRGTKDPTPSTGDDSNITMHLLLMIGSLLLLAAVFCVHMLTKPRYTPKYRR